MKESQTTPRISVIIPTLNEAGFIERCIRAILDGDYPVDRLEVIVVDGMSDDGTPDIVRRLAAENPCVRLVENPRRITPVAFNLGIKGSTGELVFIFGAHALAHPDYFSRGVRAALEHPEAWCVGGAEDTVGENYTGRVISAAMASRVGSGNALYRTGNYKGYADTVALPCYRRWVFDKVGLFDEELVRNQDDEFNFRVRRAGGRVYLDSEIRSSYYTRGAFRKLARQYLHYGFWRTRTIQKHGRPASLRQIAPVLFVLTWIALAVAALIWRPAVWALAAFAAVYALGLLVGAVGVARRAGVAEAVAAPLVFIILHFAYGIGTLKGVLWFLVLRRGGCRRPEDHPLSR
jgi:glycosyltransferase involved in cell wall biosynthesis